MKDLIYHIQSLLTPDLLSPAYRKKNNPAKYAGHCYVASETYFHLLGAEKCSYRPYILTHKEWPEKLIQGDTHWFLRSEKEVIDITAEQFNTSIPYNKARRCAFLTKSPSKRAKILLKRLEEF